MESSAVPKMLRGPFSGELLPAERDLRVDVKPDRHDGTDRADRLVGVLRHHRDVGVDTGAAHVRDAPEERETAQIGDQTAVVALDLADLRPVDDLVEGGTQKMLMPPSSGRECPHLGSGRRRRRHPRRQRHRHQWGDVDVRVATPPRPRIPHIAPHSTRDRRIQLGADRPNLDLAAHHPVEERTARLDELAAANLDDRHLPVHELPQERTRRRRRICRDRRVVCR